jgi:hypothetical protein
MAVPGPAPELAPVGCGFGDSFLELYLELGYLIGELPYIHATAAERDEVPQDLWGLGDLVIAALAHAEEGHGVEDQTLVIEAPFVLLLGLAAGGLAAAAATVG